ncbi:MAG: hypothetical protein CMM96_03515 [Rickettsiales bacterium]|nr:hypothetical protein [Rickettsiales bacterium]
MTSIKYILIFFEFIFLMLGVYLPLANTTEFWIFKSEFSIFSLSYQFLISDELILFIVVFLFGFIFPLIKIISRIFKFEYISRFNLHKFSMVDIFLISFLVFIGKSSTFFEIQLSIGFYFLLMSVLIGYFSIIFDKYKL